MKKIKTIARNDRKQLRISLVSPAVLGSAMLLQSFCSEIEIRKWEERKLWGTLLSFVGYGFNGEIEKERDSGGMCDVAW
jgi:hypothetical protein